MNKNNKKKVLSQRIYFDDDFFACEFSLNIVFGDMT